MCTILSVYIQDEYLVMTEAYYGGGEDVVMTASYVHTKQILSQILLLCGMDQKME